MAKKDVLPPYPNRGAQNTWRSGLIACVDWVSITFKNVDLPSDIMDLLGIDFDDFTHFDNGKYGYSYHYRYGHIAIYYSDSRPDIYLELTGQGCREFEEHSDYDWSTFFGLVLMLDINIPRLDLALDDYQGYLDFAVIKRKIKAGLVRSRFKSSEILDSYLLSDGSNLGTTVYFGSARSRIQVRIYDKLKERLKKGHEVLDGVDHWIRTEIQLRDDRAGQAAIDIAKGSDNLIGQEIAGILRNYITFCDKSNDTNKARWPVAKFWDKFLDDVEPIKLTQIAPDATIDKTKKWLEDSVAAAFVTILEAFDYNTDLLASYIHRGKSKQSKKHQNMLKRHDGGGDPYRQAQRELNKNRLLDLLLDNERQKRACSGSEHAADDQ